MARHRRPHSPGVVFHITARNQCREPLLAGIESSVIAMILENTARSDARLIAYAVMPNHLHIVLQQGARPLSHFMQPVLRRIALLVGRTHGWTGHVFERVYSESACVTPDYLRNAIAYVHLNGYRASLASTVEAYRWCSHARFCAGDAPDMLSRSAMEDAMRLFSASSTDDLIQSVANYHRFIRWRAAMDDFQRDETRVSYHPPSPPDTSGGDEHWFRCFAPHVQSEAEHTRIAVRRLDLRDLALSAIRELEPDLSLDDLRSGGNTRLLVHARRVVIQRASAAGYSGRALSRFLNISPATVSLARRRGTA